MPEFERAWLQYCELYNAPAEEQKAALGQELGGAQPAAGAFAAHGVRGVPDKRTPQLAARAWQEFTDGPRRIWSATGVRRETHRGAGGAELRWMKGRAFPPTRARNGDSRASCAWRTRASEGCDMVRHRNVCMLCAVPALTCASTTEIAAALGHGRSQRNACLLGFPPRQRPRRRRVETHRRAFLLGAAGFRALLLRHAGPRKTRRRSGDPEGNRHLSPRLRYARGPGRAARFTSCSKPR